MGNNRHPMTGAALQQPDPAPLRVWALADRDKPCTEHIAAYTGAIPCTGAYRCQACGTTWDEQGNAETMAQRAARLARWPR